MLITIVIHVFKSFAHTTVKKNSKSCGRRGRQNPSLCLQSIQAGFNPVSVDYIFWENVNNRTLKYPNIYDVTDVSIITSWLEMVNIGIIEYSMCTYSSHSNIWNCTVSINNTMYQIHLLDNGNAMTTNMFPLPSADHL